MQLFLKKGYSDKMKITIVYDNEIYKKGIGLKSDWGFACLIETKYDTILFDTGAKGGILINNMKKLHIDPSIIKKIVIGVPPSYFSFAYAQSTLPL